MMVRYYNGKEVAVKILQTYSGDDREKYLLRLLREIHYGYKLKHDNLVKILGIHYPAGMSEEERSGYTPDIVMEYWGIDLRNYVQKLGSRLQPSFKKKIILDIAKGLQCLHSLGLVHRDLKVIA